MDKLYIIENFYKKSLASKTRPCILLSREKWLQKNKQKISVIYNWF